MSWENAAIDAPMGVYAVCLFFDQEEGVYRLTPAILNHIINLNKTSVMGGNHPPAYFPVCLAQTLETAQALLEEYEPLLPALNEHLLQPQEATNGSDGA